MAAHFTPCRRRSSSMTAFSVGITGAAAVANAIYHATGKRITTLPITLDKLL